VTTGIVYSPHKVPDAVWQKLRLAISIHTVTGDREAILISSFTGTRADGREHERGVFSPGFDNGLVAITRQLMATGLLSVNDPETEKA